MKIDLTFFLVLGIVAIALLVIGMTMQQYARAQALLDEWATRNQFRIERREYRRLFKGPFFWTSARGQFVYRVTVTDARGVTRVAWVRLGSWFWGIWKKQVQVIWDETPHDGASGLQ